MRPLSSIKIYWYVKGDIGPPFCHTRLKTLPAPPQMRKNFQAFLFLCFWFNFIKGKLCDSCILYSFFFKRPRGRAVSAQDLGSWGRGFESH